MGNCVPDQFDFSQNRSIYCDNGWTADDSIIHSSASIDLGMVCSDQWKKSFAQSLYMVCTSDVIFSGTFPFSSPRTFGLFKSRDFLVPGPSGSLGPGTFSPGT